MTFSRYHSHDKCFRRHSSCRNSVLYGVSVSQLNKSQRVQNSLARVVLQQPKRAHSKPLLQHLHWLPVPQRIQYKLAVQKFKTRQTCQPSYLYNLLSSRLPITTMSPRSSSRQLLEPRCTRTVYGCRAFSVAAPNLWNTSPCDVTYNSTLSTFKKHLKTFIFNAAFIINS